MEFPNGFCLHPDYWRLPDGWRWEITRVIHDMPNDVVDGWRVVLRHDHFPAVECLHRVLDMAHDVAMDAAEELFPSAFGGWDKPKGQR